MNHWDHIKPGRLVAYQTRKMPEEVKAIVQSVDGDECAVKKPNWLHPVRVGPHDWIRVLCECCGRVLEDPAELQCPTCNEKHPASPESEPPNPETKVAIPVPADYPRTEPPKETRPMKKRQRPTYKDRVCACGKSYSPTAGNQKNCPDCKKAAAERPPRPRTKKPNYKPRHCKCGNEIPPTSPTGVCKDCKAGTKKPEKEEKSRGTASTGSGQASAPPELEPPTVPVAAPEKTTEADPLFELYQLFTELTDRQIDARGQLARIETVAKVMLEAGRGALDE